MSDNTRVNAPLTPPPSLLDEAVDMGILSEEEASIMGRKPATPEIDHTQVGTAPPSVHVQAGNEEVDWRFLAADPSVEPYSSIEEAARVEEVVDPQTGNRLVNEPHAAALHTARLAKLMASNSRRDPISGALMAGGDGTQRQEHDMGQKPSTTEGGLIRGVDGRTEYQTGFPTGESDNG